MDRIVNRKVNTIREYTDVNGLKRRIEYVREGNFVNYSYVKPPSPSEIWKLEDGSTVQIPTNMWSDFIYFDHK